MLTERIGIRFTTNEGYQVVVIDYQKRKGKPTLYQVMFLDEHKWTTWATWSNLKTGSLKNPFHRSVFGVGYLGLDKNGERPITTLNGKNKREYLLWSNMITRCYDEKYHEKEPSYKNCEVCDRWKCYAYFLEDLPLIKNYDYWKENPKQRISLDKDKYYKDLGIETNEKMYSLLTTRFISIQENTKEMIDRCGSTHHQVRCICIETGIPYESLVQAEKETGIVKTSIGSCCRGKYKTAGGLHWMYLDDYLIEQLIVNEKDSYSVMSLLKTLE